MDAFLATVMPWGGTYAPIGWMFCSGQSLGIDEYSALFSLMGTTYGGDGVTNFKLPNLCGRTPVGVGSIGGTNFQLGEMSGTEKITLTTAQLPTHTHAPTVSGLSVGPLTAKSSSGQAVPFSSLSGEKCLASPYDPGNGSDVARYNNATPNVTLNIGDVTAKVTGNLTVQSAGTSLPVSLMQPGYVVNWIICVQGIYPPYP